MNEHIKQLALSPRGRRTLYHLQHFMDQVGIGLDNANRAAYRALVEEYWRNPGTCSHDISEVLDGPGEQDIVYVAVKDDEVKVHYPKTVDARFVLLDCDDPDYPGYEARGLQHPADESAALERDQSYYTQTL